MSKSSYDAIKTAEQPELGSPEIKEDSTWLQGLEPAVKQAPELGGGEFSGQLNPFFPVSANPPFAPLQEPSTAKTTTSKATEQQHSDHGSRRHPEAEPEP